MSLIIARVHNGVTHILGDIALTYQNDTSANPFVQGCLKQYRINDRLAVAFAGDSTGFRAACKDIHACDKTAEIIEVARAAQKKGQEFDLLVAEAGKESVTFLKGGVLTESASGFIGDSLAFGAFQDCFHSVAPGTPVTCEIGRAAALFMRCPEPMTEGDFYARMFSALKQVIWDPRYPSVGGAIIPLCTDNGRFRYMNYADVTSDPLRLEDFTSTPKAIEFGTAEKGGFAMEFNDDSPHAGLGNEVGIYFLQGSLGIIFPAAEDGFRPAEVLPAKNPALWVLETSRRLGSGVSSSFLSADHCGIAGEDLWSKEDHQGAHFCYELGLNQLKHLSSAQLDRYSHGRAAALANIGRRQDAIDLLTSSIRENPVTKLCQSLLNSLNG